MLTNCVQKSARASTYAYTHMQVYIYICVYVYVYVYVYVCRFELCITFPFCFDISRLSSPPLGVASHLMLTTKVTNPKNRGQGVAGL